jgi:hypothetical protein
MDDRDAPRFFEIFAFPLEGHHSLSLVDPTYRQLWTSELAGGTEPAELPNQLELEVSIPGEPMDLSTTAMGVVVASPAAAKVLIEHAKDDVKLIPARIRPENREWWVVKVTSLVDCLSAYEEFGEIEIDPARVGDEQIFRPAKRPQTVVTTDSLFQALIEAKLPVLPGLLPCKVKKA